MYISSSSSAIEVTTSEEAMVTLMAVGDIMLGDHPICIGHGVGAKIGKRGAIYPFQQVASTLQKGDIVFGNLEVVLSDRGKNRNQLRTLQLKATPEAAEGLKYAGFNVLSLANNHALEHGEGALLDTMNVLSEHNIKYIGVDSDITKARMPLIIDMKGITIAFLAYCLIPNKTAYISIKNTEEICYDVKEAKSGAGLVIVSLHWGDEYIERPSPSQIRLAHQIIDSGANIILGHHPHIVQGIERYHNGVITYSLGNFVFDMWQKETKQSMILSLRLSRDSIRDIEVLPVHINRSYQPEILKGEAAENLLSEIERLSSKIAIEDSSAFYNSLQEYAAEVATRRRQYRRGLKWYFLRNLYRYPPRFTLQMVRDYLSRAKGRGL